MKKITLMIPCHNEEKGIADVITSIPYDKLKRYGYEIDVLVIDNRSTDKTGEVAKNLDVKVIYEPRMGKGNAIRTGFANVSEDTDYVVMLDGDNTYKSYEILRMVEPLDSGFCDVVIGSRLEGKMKGESMSFSHRMANWFFTFLTRRFYRANVTDTCTGYFAWKKDVADHLNGHIKSRGFAIEAEMISKMAKMGYDIHAVPITYEKRTGDSKLSPWRDGLRITAMLIRNRGWKVGR